MYYEDFSLRRKFETGSIDVTREEIVAFANRYDPQPFHLEEASGKKSIFGGLVASGWMTVGLTMRLLVQSVMSDTPMIGLGVNSLQWPRPVHPGDRLTATAEVVEARPSASKPEFGLIALRTIATNQMGETVLKMVSHQLVRRRPAAKSRGAKT